jgi:tyrosyl-tRNA synthetase
MYRYYELLTDMPLAEIGRVKAEVAAGARNPMDVKMELGRRIVADFHSEGEATGALEAFDLEVRQGKEPTDTETVDMPPSVVTDKGIRVDKLLAMIGLADSVTDATRKLKAGAVEINGSLHKDLLHTGATGTLTLRLGKRWKRVKV